METNINRIKKEEDKNVYQKKTEIDKKIKNNQEIIYSKNRFNSILILTIILIVLGFFNYNSAISRFDNEIITEKRIKYLCIIGTGLLSAFLAYYSVIPFRRKKDEEESSYYFLNNIFNRALIFNLGVIVFLIVAFLNIPLFPTINGGKGWIRLPGFSLQITEVYKIPFIVLLAGFLTDIKMNHFKKRKRIGSYIKFGSTTFVFIFLLIFLNDLGTGIHYLIIAVFMLFMSEISDKFVYGTVGISIPVALIGLSGYYKFGSGYKHHRLKTFIDSFINSNYNREDSFQVFQSLIGFGTAGLLGKGYGNGIQKYNYIPEVETDFAIATFGEEFGFIGMIFILSIFWFLFILMMKTAETSKDYFAKYLASGIAGYFMSQVLINIGVAIGIIPVFGIPLPLISAGGSSFIAILIAVAIILRISRDNLSMFKNKN